MKESKRNSSLGASAMMMLVLSVLLSTTASAAPSYVVKDLGTLGGTNSYASPVKGINRNGQVVGRSQTAGDTAEHAFLYDGKVMHDLGTLDGTNSQANGISDYGVVVGIAQTSGDTGWQPFLYLGNRMFNLNNIVPLPSGWLLNGAMAIDWWSDASTMNITGVGTHNLKSVAFEYYLISTNLSLLDLGTLGGPTSQGFAISGNCVAGYSLLAGPAGPHAFLTGADPTITDLGTLGGSESWGNGVAVTSDVEVVGWAQTESSTATHAFLYSHNSGTMIDLGTLGGSMSEARDINRSHQVVGWSLTAGDTGQAAFLYSDGTMFDLNSLIPSSSGWSLLRASGINDLGQIAGQGRIGGAVHAFLLTPGWEAAVAMGASVPVALGPYIAITFSDVMEAGSVTAVLVQEGSLPAPPDFRIVGGTSYDITTDASLSFAGQAQVCIGYDETKITVPEQQLALVHYSGSTATVITTLVDKVNNRVCGLTNSFSAFAVAEPEHVYVFEGFFSPVDNPPTANNSRSGQAIPVKWRLTGASGEPVSDPASFKSLSSYSMGCGAIAGDPVDSIEEYAAGASGLQYSGDGYWQYNWKTPKTYAGTCRKMVLTLGDGATHAADFKFR